MKHMFYDICFICLYETYKTAKKHSVPDFYNYIHLSILSHNKTGGINTKKHSIYKT